MNPEETGETLYVETSALLRAFLERDVEVEASLARCGRFFTSALTLVEAPRALARARRDGRVDPALIEEAQRRFALFVQATTVVEITPEVRERAALDFPVEPVRSLDAIHLATLVSWADAFSPLRVATCDERVSRNAVALGFEVVPPSRPVS